MSREEYFASTIFSHNHKPDFVGLLKALLNREDVTYSDLAQVEALVQLRKESL